MYHFGQPRHLKASSWASLCKHRHAGQRCHAGIRGVAIEDAVIPKLTVRRGRNQNRGRVTPKYREIMCLTSRRLVEACIGTVTQCVLSVASDASTTSLGACQHADGTLEGDVG